MDKIIDQEEPLVRRDKRGRIKVKIIFYNTRSLRVNICKTILLPLSKDKSNLKTRLKKSCWTRVTIQCKDVKQAERYCILTKAFEIRKGYTIPRWLCGHPKPPKYTNVEIR
jgi:hypothetical protein